MFKFLGGLFGGGSRDQDAPAEPDDRVRFAGLICGELKLYKAKLLKGLALDAGLQSELKVELERAYRMYADRTASGSERGKIFRESAVRILADGNTALLEPSLSEVLREADDRTAKGERADED